MSKRTVLKLGTRRSLLAWAQSGQVAAAIEKANPGLKVERVGIDTRGDKILDIPLQKVEGKEFFVAEIDDALRSGAVDLTVHSLKDLSLERPTEFVLAAMPERANSRDVAIFGPRVLEKLRRGETLQIGTSSPRRLENLPSFLAKALPRFGSGNSTKLQFVEIRGNVNTRLGRLHEADTSDRHLDGVILAFAGLIRLWADVAARAEMTKLFQGARWMVLPLRENPSAPGQGALAVECRADDDFVREALAKLDHPATRSAVATERGLLAAWGGGCHQRFGASSVEASGLGALLYVRGVRPDGVAVDELQWKAPPAPSGALRAWDGSLSRAGAGAGVAVGAGAEASAPALSLASGTPVFVAHWRALAPAWEAPLAGARVWCSGTASWYRLAERGVWVEGCAEGLGFDEALPQLAEPVLGLPGLERWTVLTHHEALAEWQGRVAQVVGTYSAPGEAAEYAPQAVAELESAEAAWWSSGSQFTALAAKARSVREHACGPGRTARVLRAAGVEPRIFPSVEEWRQWLKSV
jgi:hydroxymethylbilane synthase